MMVLAAALLGEGAGDGVSRRRRCRGGELACCRSVPSLPWRRACRPRRGAAWMGFADVGGDGENEVDPEAAAAPSRRDDGVRGSWAARGPASRQTVGIEELHAACPGPLLGSAAGAGAGPGRGGHAGRAIWTPCSLLRPGDLSFHPVPPSHAHLSCPGEIQRPIPGWHTLEMAYNWL